MKGDTRADRAAKRRFAILEMLHNRPHTFDEIITVLTQRELLDYDRFAEATTVSKQQKYQFRHDRAALRLMGCRIDFERSSRCYVWRNSPFGLHLSQQHIATFALLLDTFDKSIMLHADEIRSLLAHFIKLLPSEQQKELTNQSRFFSIDLHETTDYRNTDPVTINKIELAIKRKQQLEFTYRSAYDGKERRHVIEPRPLVYEHGHVYLYGWSIDKGKELRFRPDYIVPGSVSVLPITIASSRPTRNTKQLRYHLNAVIARNSVSQHFDGQVVESHLDGSATVTAQISDLFEARRILLSYGLNCTVLEPPELVEEMRKHATGLYKMYCTPG